MSTPINGSSRPYTATVEDSARFSDNEGTMVNEGNGNGNENQNGQFGHHLTISTSNRTEGNPARPSPSQNREQRSRLEDDLEMLRAEQVITTAASTNGDDTGMANSHSMHRSRSRRSEPVDDFDVATNPLHEKAAVYRPPDNPTTKFAKVLIRIHNSSFLIRYFTYIVPLVALLLVPLLLGALVFKRASVGGVYLLWFSVWLEIVWLTLWAGRILAKALPWPIGMISSVFTNNSKKWRDLGRQLEVPATIFFWWLAIQISFLPTMKNHHVDGNKTTRPWEATMNKIIGAIFIGTILNFVEKIIIQLIAISFHLRTYADRIEINKFQIASLVKLYTYSKEKIQMEDSDFEQADVPTGPSSGTRTPMAYINEARKGAKDAMTKVGDVAGKVAGDFTGKQVAQSNHPHQVVLMLLSTTSGSQVLARRLYRTFAREETETVFQEDLKNAFGSDDEAEAAFQMFDKDLNGDISMEELEACCADVGRERKSITASLADLDSVVSKLDNVLFFVVLVITLLVFISLVSASAAGVLTSAGSTVLALSWLFAATAQEFLQSVIFVFVKHPFDVGDRVSIYGNTGSQLKGDDYFVKEIALLYTEFKKMEGQVVQAPNSYLNTLFILNMRRSGGLAEAVPVVIKFGTTLEQIEGLRNRLLEFVTAEKREYAQKILTELRDVTEAHSLTLNIVFFYKSNWQNELLRLQRRNKFICAMMVSMQELGIEGPRMRLPGQKEDTPMYLHSKSGSFMPGATSDVGQGPDVDPQPAQGSLSGNPTGSILKRSGQGSSRLTGESMSAYSRRVDFSLGMRDMSAGDLMGDIHEERSRPRVPIQSISPSRSQFRRTSTEDNLARTTSHDTHSTLRGGTGRVSSDSQARLRTSQSQSTHRNRFFGRSRPEVSVDGDRSEADLEAGTAMNDIPESGPSSSSRGRLDPRSGLVSPQAIYSSTTPAGIPIISGGAGPQSFAHPYVLQQQQHPQPPVLSLSHVASQGNGVVDRQGTGDIPIQGRAAEDYEMRRFS